MIDASRGAALVTGASSGIGEAFARRLARDGYDVILVARRRELLEKLAEELRGRNGVRAAVEVADLANGEDVARLEKLLTESEDITALVNNAGYATGDRFAETEIEGQVDMVMVHDVATIRLIRAALPGMIARHRGDIINVSSVAGLIPWGHATYCASKAFLVAFTEALHMELRGGGVRVQALCPGFTRTGFHEAWGVDTDHTPGFMWMSADEVVDESVAALRRGKVVFVPGTKNRVYHALMRAVPRRVLFKLMAAVRRAAGRE